MVFSGQAAKESDLCKVLKDMKVTINIRLNITELANVLNVP
jgi:hypothetical protein